MSYSLFLCRRLKMMKISARMIPQLARLHMVKYRVIGISFSSCRTTVESLGMTPSMKREKSMTKVFDKATRTHEFG